MFVITSHLSGFFFVTLQQSRTLRTMAQLIVNVTVRRATGGDPEGLTSPKHFSFPVFTFFIIKSGSKISDYPDNTLITDF